MKGHSNADLSLRNRQQTDLNRFAQEFKDEAQLRQVIANLLPKLGALNVRITHGHGERGKDIIFYMSGPLSREVLYACVIKNSRISGQADSSSGAQTILNQAVQALTEPYINRVIGTEEKVHTVYIMSPEDPSPDAIESIKVGLRERSRQVEFLCGIDLLALFQEHWPDFLRFESAVLTRYLTDLRAGLSVDKALVTLLTRQNANLGLKPFESFYVPSPLVLRVDLLEPPQVRPPMPDFLMKYLPYTAVEDNVSRMRFWLQVLRSPELAGETETVLTKCGSIISQVSRTATNSWDQALKNKNERPEYGGRDERRLVFSLEVDQEYPRFVAIIERVYAQLVKINRATKALHKEASFLEVATGHLLQNENLSQMSNGYDFLSALPGVIRRKPGKALPVSPEILFSNCRCVLISGAPGSGKTSFCRWHTLKSVEAFLSDQTQPLPIYVPAHRLASGKIDDFDDTFLGGIDLREVQVGLSDEKSVPIRLFLDGLDEVPDRQQQQLMIETIKEGLRKYSRLTVVVTSRPYVWGNWLNWIPRVHMAELSSANQEQLARNWLGDEQLVRTFFQALRSFPALTKLMETPLLATLILNLYRKTPRLPENKASLYRTFVDLYCGGWDAAKGLAKAGQFRNEQKLRPLAALAYRMHVSHVAECQESLFVKALTDSLPGLSRVANDVLSEVIQDGILVRVGRELLFAHLSFQEYLAAQFLASDPTGERPKHALRSFLNGEDWWKDVVEFYIISRDDPAIIDDWIMRMAARVRDRQGATEPQGPRSDLSIRLDSLAICMQETFSGYIPHFRSK